MKKLCLNAQTVEYHEIYNMKFIKWIGTEILLGFKSRWMILFWCRYSIAWEIANANFMQRFSSRKFGRVLHMNFWRFPPLINSVIIIISGSAVAPINCLSNKTPQQLKKIVQNIQIKRLFSQSCLRLCPLFLSFCARSIWLCVIYNTFWFNLYKNN